MLKQLIQLLVNQLVPKRAVSGGGGSVYGASASSLGTPDYSSFITVDVADGDINGSYVMPYDGMVVASSQATSANEPQAIQLAARSMGSTIGISTVRRNLYNSDVFILAAKGTDLIYTVRGVTNKLYIFKLIPN